MRSHIYIITTLVAVSMAACSDEGSGGLGELRAQARIPARIDFEEVPLGTLRRLSLLIENVGDTPLEVSRIVPDEDFVTETYRFSLARTDGFQIPIGESETIDIDFVPLADEEVSEESGLTIEWNAETDGRVVLVGRGVGAQLDIDPEPLDFGSVLWGSTKTATLTITSRHDVPVEVFTRLDGTGRPLIEPVEGTGTFTLLEAPDPSRGGALTPADTLLDPNAEIRVALRYRPEAGSEAVRDQSRWTVATCTPAVCGKPVQLLGTPRPDAFECEPADIDFGPTNPGEAAVLTSTCTNVVTESVVFKDIETQTGPEGFSLLRVPPEQVVAPDESIVFTFEFDPLATSVGSDLAREFLVRHEKTDGTALRPVLLTARGRAGRPAAEVSTDVLRFPDTAISTVSRRTFTISNRGSDQLSVSIERDGQFRPQQQALQIAAMSSQQVVVTFNPINVGPASGTLRITTNDSQQPEFSIAVSGTGSPVPPCSYSLTPSSISFGFVPIGETVERRISVFNPGPGPCLINDFRLDTASPDLTLVDAPSGNRNLEANTSTSAVVSFTPTSDRRAAGVVSFYISSTDNSSPEIAVSGRGVTDPLIIAPNPIRLSLSPSCPMPRAEVTIVNPYSTPNAISDIRIDGTSSIEIVGAPNLPLPMGAGQTVRFELQGSGQIPAQGLLVITTPDGQEGYQIPVELDTDPTTTAVFDATATNELDLLFVVGDNSRFLQTSQRLPDAAQAMVNALSQAGIDYRLGVVRARVSDGSCPVPRTPNRPLTLEQGLCGYLADGGLSGAVDPTWRVIDPRTVPTATVAFRTTLQQPTRIGFDRPELFSAVREALVEPIAGGWNAPFRRPSTPLAVVVISTEDNAGGNLDGASLALALRVLSDGPVAVSAASGPRSNNCFNSPIFGLAAPNLHDAIEASGGTWFSICDATWPAELIAGGLPLTGHKRRYTVDRPADPITFEVQVDGTSIPAQDPMTNAPLWTSSRDGVVFTSPPAGQVSVTYEAACQ